MMNIHNIQILQGLQNVSRSFCEDSSASVSKGSISTAAMVSRGFGVEKSDTSLGQSLQIIGQINNLQSDLKSDPNVVLYPPFFPIATYQRLNLIQKVRGIEREIKSSSIDESLKSAISDNSLKDDATDIEISEAIGKLFALRNELTDREKVSSNEIKPGLILSIEA